MIENLQINPDFDNSQAEISFVLTDDNCSVEWEIFDDAGQMNSGKVSEAKDEKIFFTGEMKNFKPWNMNSPHLYTLKLKLQMPNSEKEITEKFGMRKIHVSGNQIFVNNIPFIVRGYIRGREAHDHPNLKSLSLYDYYAENIAAAKSYGFNFVRFHSKIPPDECFQAADDLGMFIHVEIRKYFGKYQKEREFMNDDGEIINEQQWREAIASMRNHPSLMVYCMGNEIRHPGSNPFVEHIAKVTHELDPSRLFIDTCAHGEFDRTYVDIDVQHMSYYYPFGKDYDMMNSTQNWLIFGSCKGTELTVQDKDDDYSYKIRRSLPAKRPILAHEICHYAALRDIDAIEKKFIQNKQEKPWWIDELKKLVEQKHLQNDYPQMLAASKHFQKVGWKLGIEGARRSHLLCGYHFLQLADTERYENSNGILDCFDESTGVDEKMFKSFNSDIAILADLPERTYFEKNKLLVPVILSHFSPETNGKATFEFELTSENINMQGAMNQIDLDICGRREVALLELKLPELDKAEMTTLTLSLVNSEGIRITSNSWKIWVYPDKPDKLPALSCTADLKDVNTQVRYPQIELKGTSKNPEKLLITDHFSDGVFGQLEKGNDVLILYRIPETRDRKNRGAKREKYYLPATWDRLKGVIWDRGHNLGAFMRNNPIFEDFPTEGYLDLQFHGIVDDCDKICLDDFPVDIEPIIQGVDKASRDRFDVYTFKYPELMPEWTMRKFAYLFEVQVGKGRLLVSGFNFTRLAANNPETCAMFEAIIRYATGKDFNPKAEVTVDNLKNYLLKKGGEPRIRERKMTQYWQLDEEPLESDRYWKESEEYIREEMKIGGK